MLACVDANIVVRLLLCADPSAAVAQLWYRLARDAQEVVAPVLLYYEVANALHRLTVAGELDVSEAEQLMGLALSLGLQVSSDTDLHQRALRIATEHGLPAAYDAHYLALCELAGAQFWTADKRLAGAVQEHLPWFHFIDLTS